MTTPTPLQRYGTPLVLSAALLLSGCSALQSMQAQNPGTALQPVNAVKADEAPRLMLKGADVVAYFTQGRYVPGSAAHRSEYQGVSFQFASAEHKALFDQSPQQYLPQYGGYCANGIVYGIPWGGDADAWRLIDGKLYIFGGRASQEGFELDIPANRAMADRYWREEVAGANSFLQRAKRLVFRVPHYQSGAEIAEAVAKAKAAGPAR